MTNLGQLILHCSSYCHPWTILETIPKKTTTFPSPTISFFSLITISYPYNYFTLFFLANNMDMKRQSNMCLGCVYSKVAHFLKKQESPKSPFSNVKILIFFNIIGSMIIKFHMSKAINAILIGAYLHIPHIYYKIKI